MSSFKPLPYTDDTETAALDEAFSALGQLLAAAEPPLNEGELVRSVCARLGRRRTAQRRSTAVLAMAAALLLALGLAWWPRPAARPAVAVVPRLQSPAVADFAWHDELAEEVDHATFALWSIESRAQTGGHRAYWMLQEMDELEHEMELNPL